MRRSVFISSVKALTRSIFREFWSTKILRALDTYESRFVVKAQDALLAMEVVHKNVMRIPQHSEQVSTFSKGKFSHLKHLQGLLTVIEGRGFIEIVLCMEID